MSQEIIFIMVSGRMAISKARVFYKYSIIVFIMVTLGRIRNLDMDMKNFTMAIFMKESIRITSSKE